VKTLRRGALAGAALIALCAAAQATPIMHAPIAMAAKKIAHRVTVHHTVVRHARTRFVRRDSHVRYARSYYDYYDAQELREGLSQDDRQAAANPERQAAPYDGDIRFRDDAGETASGPPIALNGRDFSGGVGYGESGDMGYQGGYGRPDPRNGNFDMNGGAMSNAAAARFSPWHGYNSHNGPGNGY
jgi:hypothetical protein